MTNSTLCPKIYHIIHIDRLASILNDGFLYCDAMASQKPSRGTVIGMNSIKQRRLTLPIKCRPGLHVGDCVPFYFCPRSVMLYIINCGNHPELIYRGGQEPILHLEFDFYNAIDWAEKNRARWAFTLSNAGSHYFEDRCSLTQLEEINWSAIATDKWSGSGVSKSVRESKQAEFLIESRFPWNLIERIGVYSIDILQQVNKMLAGVSQNPVVEIKRGWYYAPVN